MSAWMSLCMALIAAAPAGEGTVTISGVVAHTGSGQLTAELLVVGDGPPLLAWTGQLNRPGPFSFQVPAGLGSARLRIAADAQSDGIGADDAQALWPEVLQIQSDDITGLDMSLKRSDLPQRR